MSDQQSKLELQRHRRDRFYTTWSQWEERRRAQKWWRSRRAHRRTLAYLRKGAAA